MLRTGLVGVGKMGVSHMAIAGAHPDLDVVAVCDNQGFVLSALRSQIEVTTYRDVDRMLDDAGLDCLFVATPTRAHVDIASRAIERGVHVFVEKPLSLSSHDSRRLANMAAEHGVANQVGYHNRFIGTFQEVARLVGAGAIGTVHHIDGRAFGQVVTRPSGGGMTWRARKSEGGGCLHDYACHVVDLMDFVVGCPERIVAGSLTSVHSRDVEDAVHALMLYPGGATGSLETNWSDPSYRKMTTTITVYGSLGKIVADRQECQVFLHEGHEFEDYQSGWTIRYITELQPPVAFYLRGEEYSAQVDSFARSSMAGGADGPSTFSTAADADWVVEEIARVHAAGGAADHVAVERQVRETRGTWRQWLLDAPVPSRVKAAGTHALETVSRKFGRGQR